MKRADAPEPSGAVHVSALVVIYDIRGFTAASRRIGATEIGRFAEAAHKAILDVFADRPPTFLKNLGDGYLLLWEISGAPDPSFVADVVERASTARTAFDTFVAAQRAAGADVSCRLGVGIAFGEVARADDYYGVALNRASRLQNLARPEGIALDPIVFRAASVVDETLADRLRRVRVRLKGLGRTTAWVGRPFSWARAAARAAVVAAFFVLPLGYVALADAGLALPAGTRVRRQLDEWDASLFRKPRPDPEVREAADRARRTLSTGLLRATLPVGAVQGNLGDPADTSLDIWASSQAICGLLRTPHLAPSDLTPLLGGLEVLFSKEHFHERDGVAYGWVPRGKLNYTEAEPTLWTVAALAMALGRPGVVPPEERARFEGHLRSAQRAALAYRPLEDGGWNTFPDQDDPERSSPYTTGLALLALLETRAAGLPWEGSVERRDALLRSTVAHLVGRFVGASSPPGWRGTPDASDPISFGFTWQAYATLLRAEAEAGVSLPPGLLDSIPRALARLGERGEEDLRGSLGRYDAGEFSVSFRNVKGEPDQRNEAINFLWQPWAIETASRWLPRAEKAGAPHADVVAARRALGMLVVDVGDDAVAIALSGYTFVASETLYCLSAVPAP